MRPPDLPKNAALGFNLTVKRAVLVGIVAVVAILGAVWLFENYYYDREQIIYIRKDSR
jgi:hypothetical protein